MSSRPRAHASLALPRTRAPQPPRSSRRLLLQEAGPKCGPTIDGAGPLVKMKESVDNMHSHCILWFRATSVEWLSEQERGLREDGVDGPVDLGFTFRLAGRGVWTTTITHAASSDLRRRAPLSGEIGRGAPEQRPRLSVGRRLYGVSLLIRVDQFPWAVRSPGPCVGPAHVPSRLSPLPSTKKGPPHVV